MLVPIHTRQMSHAPSPAAGPPAEYPWLVESDFGLYRSWVRDGVIWVSWASVPQGAAMRLSSLAAGESPAFPRLVCDPRGWLRLLYQRPTGGSTEVVERLSYDDGLTWSDAVAVFDGGQFPTGNVTRTGTLCRMAYIDGTLVATVQSAGMATMSDPFTLVDEDSTPLAPAEDTFHWWEAPDGRWLLFFRTDGETAPATWWSADWALSWTRLT